MEKKDFNNKSMKHPEIWQKMLEGVHWPIFYYEQENYSLTKQSKWTKSGRLKLINLAYRRNVFSDLFHLICFAQPT